MSALLAGPARGGAGVSGVAGLPGVADHVARGRRARGRRRRRVVAVLAVLAVTLWWLSLSLGETAYTPGEVLAVLTGADASGAAFVVGELRLPRAVTGLVVGASLGLAGTTFQTVLRNPLASPDVIGVTSGASAAAVVGIVVLGLGEVQVAALAVVAALVTGAAVHALAWVDGLSTARLVLVGIGVAAMLDSVVAAVVLRAATWDLQTAVRWLTGSLNGSTWAEVLPAVAALVLLGPLLLAHGSRLDLLRLGDDTATALGVPVTRTRVVVLLAAVALVAFATAAAGPVAFVALLSGPLALRLVGAEQSLLVPAALVGACLVLGADLVAALALDTRYPVGVVTGALGAPFLLWLLVRSHRTGGPT